MSTWIFSQMIKVGMRRGIDQTASERKITTKISFSLFHVYRLNLIGSLSY